MLEGSRKLEVEEQLNSLDFNLLIGLIKNEYEDMGDRMYEDKASQQHRYLLDIFKTSKPKTKSELLHFVNNNLGANFEEEILESFNMYFLMRNL